ncbi:GntR family transcriptional regulator [Variovorax sp. HJSM1_2]|uniref:GntR family transcriptional regulator n=1 Tax=Variovorax sp. HJSM1_2 TaxID=3366263 RepID=UPI003BC086E2
MTTSSIPMLDRDSKTPLWQQLRDKLRQQIVAGQLGVNAQLPTEAELGAAHGVSRIVVRECLADLVRSGLVYKIQGKGAFISAPKREDDFASTLLAHSDEMRLKGRAVRTQVLHQTLRLPDAREATALSLQAGTQVTALRRLRSVDGTISVLVDTVVPADLAPELHRIRLEDKSLYEVLSRQYGLQVARAERWIDAVLPAAEERELLQIDSTEPLLRIESIAYAANGRTLEHYIALHRCQSTRLHVRTQG